MPDDLSLSLRARVALQSHGFHFSHTLGQNFLLDEDTVREIVSRAGVKNGDYILEIGPGAGVMTAVMLDAGARVLAIELDRALKDVLADVLGTRKGATLVFEDAIKADISRLVEDTFGAGAPYSIVANLPYYITSDFLLRAVRLSPAPERITAMVQKEAAQRIMSSPGEKNWCALAASVRYFAEAEALMDAPPSLFTPPPHVESRLLQLNMKKNRPLSAEDELDLINLIENAFLMRRKTMANNLCAARSLPREKAIEALSRAGLDARVRGETLTLDAFMRLRTALLEG